MPIVDLLFVEILRFTVIAMVVLAASLIALRFLKQPLERIRLIQIALLMLFTNVVIGAAGVVPKFELALLPETT